MDHNYIGPGAYPGFSEVIGGGLPRSAKEANNSLWPLAVMSFRTVQ